MQNQPKGIVKVLFNPYDQTKNKNVFYVSILWKSTRNKRSLHIYRLPTKSTLYTCFVVYTLIWSTNLILKMYKNNYCDIFN